MTFQGNRSSFLRKRLAWALLGLVLFPIMALQAAPPSWWSQRGATTNSPADDFAAVNQGQLKHFTKKAVEEMNARLPGGAGADLNALLQTWATQYQAGGYSAANPYPADFNAITVGQLKWIAQKIQTRLLTVRYTTTFPVWLQAHAASDTQVANLGQLKTLFAFDLSAPVSQLPLWWQRYYFNGQTGIDPQADTDGDGLTNLEELQLGTNPVGQDTDNDGLTDGTEFLLGSDPNKADSDNNGIPDNQEDNDGDGLPNGWEQNNGTNPTQDDAEKDEEPDGLTNTEELEAGTYPFNAYSDNDPVEDGEDVCPLFGDIQEPRVPKTRFAIVELGAIRGKLKVNSNGQIIADEPMSYWENGQWQPSSNPLLDLNDTGGIVGSVEATYQNGTYQKLVYWPSFGASPMAYPVETEEGEEPRFLGRGWGTAVNSNGVICQNYHTVGFLDANSVLLGNKTNGNPWDINDQQEIVGQVYGNTMSQRWPAYWSGPTADALPLLDSANYGVAVSINNKGFIVGSADGQSYLWYKKTGTYLPYPLTNLPTALSDRLEIIVADGKLWRNDQIRPITDFLPPDSGYSGFQLDSISNNGLIAASASKAGNQRSLLLLPVELVDTKDRVFDDLAPQGTTITAAMRDVNIEPKATVEEQKERSIAWIEPHGEDNGNNGPDMPQLALRFRGTEQMGLKIKWKLEVIYDRPTGNFYNPNDKKLTQQQKDTITANAKNTIKEQDEVFVPAIVEGEQQWKEEILDGAVEIFNHADWIAALQEKGFFAGEAKLTYQLLKADGSALGTESTMLFSIGGKNPEDNLAKDYIDTEATAADSRLARLSYAVARHESKGYNGDESRYNQFWEAHGHRFSNDHRRGAPLWCKSPKEKSAGGFGIFQITGNLNSQFAIIPREQMWNWQKNTDAYVTIVKRGGTAAKGSVMDRFIAAVARTYPSDAEAQTAPASFPYGGDNYDAWEMGTITLYNGGEYPPRVVLNAAGKKTKMFLAWNYETSRAVGSRWRYYPNSNNYLHEVIQQR